MLVLFMLSRCKGSLVKQERRKIGGTLRAFFHRRKILSFVSKTRHHENDKMTSGRERRVAGLKELPDSVFLSLSQNNRTIYGRSFSSWTLDRESHMEINNEGNEQSEERADKQRVRAISLSRTSCRG